MKLYRNAVILIVILGLLIGAYFYISSRQTANSDPLDESIIDDTIYVMKSEREQITSITFNNDNGTFTITKKDDKWSIDPSYDFEVDNLNADGAVTDMSSIVANKVIEENVTDLSKYGLDKPITVKVGLSDGSSKELLVGSYTLTEDGRYCKMSGESKVYLVGTYYTSKFEPTYGYFVKKDILPVDATTLKTFSYEKNGQVQYAVDIVSETEMNIVEPIKEVADTSDVSKMLQAVTQLTINDVVDNNPTDLNKYGLDKPAYVLKFGDATTTKNILFGNYVEKGTIRYAKYAEKNSIFTIDTSPLTFLDTKLEDIIYSFIYLPNIKDVNKVELLIDGKKLVCDITTGEDSSDDKFKVNGTDANMKNEKGDSLFRNMYQGMIGITMQKYEVDAKPSGTPEISIKYHMKDSKIVTVDLISKDSNYYYAVKDGVYTNKVVQKSRLNEKDGLRTTYNELMEALKESEKQ
ncbi:DUF4340 domain-containing protein [Ruminiclostridium herbifermentans]|uniref:DUF4340 domain-containing protein n=1 Tax=Ruminiclostridium herbifermentans TaxID=2488810 RepID=A0A4U7JK29_9FIRM|nr:DUF4340 domain-containing protein [Ruminiclostridium herbifermentans]QNU66595.1 DUF4340 domain-containing protein [Ruminiclostridium herbifermentans]